MIPEQAGNYGVTGLQNGLAWGTKNVLEWLDPVNVAKLMRIVVKPYIIDKSETSTGDVQYELMHGVGGGYLFRN